MKNDKNAPYTPSEVANFFLKVGKKDKQMTQMKLNKLVYFAQGWHLALKKTPLFDEDVQAWQHGPVIPSLYHEFKHFGANKITPKTHSVQWNDEDGLYYKIIEPTDKDTKTILNKIWFLFGRYNGWELRNLTHQKDTPWSKADKSFFHSIIDKKDIQNFYIKYLKDLIERSKN
jgi:uncharacterized phage-associated protein